MPRLFGEFLGKLLTWIVYFYKFSVLNDSWQPESDSFVYRTGANRNEAKTTGTDAVADHANPLGK
ncbi:MAG TPA: hypothetical protein VJL29_13630, partial [Thermoguttaceae bacterium]|nr:hypothetical protein [Thermoguttaceae bacterium]